MPAHQGELDLENCTIDGVDLAYVLGSPENRKERYVGVKLDEVTVVGGLVFAGTEMRVVGSLYCKRCRFVNGIILQNCFVPGLFSFEQCTLGDVWVAKSRLDNLQVYGLCSGSSLDFSEFASGRCTLEGHFDSLHIRDSEMPGLFDATSCDIREVGCYNNKFRSAFVLSGINAQEVHVNGNVFESDCDLSDDGIELLQVRDNTFAGAFYANKYPDSPLSGKVLIEFNRFQGQTSFAGLSARTFEIRISKQGGSIRFEKGINLENLKCEHVDLINLDFLDRTLFTGASIGLLRMKDVVFRGLVDFENTKFNANLSNVRFEKGVEANWARFQKPTSLPFLKALSTKCDSRTWRSLSAAFKERGNLVGQNGAYYQERRQSRRDDPDENRFWNTFSLISWGYGVRPLRLAAWLLVVTIAFAVAYSFALPSPPSSTRWSHARALFAFSAHTAWSFDYGLKNAVTLKWKMVTLAQSLLSKAMLVCLAQALANVSPLLHDLFGKFIQF